MQSSAGQRFKKRKYIRTILRRIKIKRFYCFCRIRKETEESQFKLSSDKKNTRQIKEK